MDETVEQTVIDDLKLAALARLTPEGTLAARAAALVEALAGDDGTCALRWWDGAESVTLATAGPQRASVVAPEPRSLLDPLRRGERLARLDLDLERSDPADEGWLRLVTAAGLRGLVAWPLRAAGEVAGALVLYAADPDRLGELTPAREEAVVALAERYLAAFPESPEPARGQPDAALRQALIELHLDRDETDVCRRAVDHLADLLGATWTAVARLESATKRFEVHLPGERFDLALDESPLLTRVIAAKAAVEVDPRVGTGPLTDRMRARGVTAALALPLLFQGEIFGVLQLGFTTAEDLDAAARAAAGEFAFHLALALRDASLQRSQTTALEQLGAAREEVLQSAKFRALVQMAGGVAHEFNNALGGILARVQMLQRQTHDRQLLKGLKTISEIGWRAAETVRRLQEFTRERSEQDFTPMAAAELWDRLTAAVRQQVADFARLSGCRYHVELEAEGLEGHLLANATELIEAVGNVVTNALEATDGGGVIMLGARTTTDALHLTIVDRGRGMTLEELQSCFDPFYSTKAETGVGLGLSVAYGIVSRHKGEIELHSEPGAGTAAEIVLPLTAADAPLDTTVPHILVIDDEPALCEVLSELFTGCGYTVDTAAGGREGIEKYHSQHFSLVCTDLRTEDLSGWEVIRAVKESGRHVPVMLLTGFREQLRPEQIEASGVDAVLGKPFTLQQVLQSAEKLLQRERV